MKLLFTLFAILSIGLAVPAVSSAGDMPEGETTPVEVEQSQNGS